MPNPGTEIWLLAALSGSPPCPCSWMHWGAMFWHKNREWEGQSRAGREGRWKQLPRAVVSPEGSLSISWVSGQRLAYQTFWMEGKEVWFWHKQHLLNSKLDLNLWKDRFRIPWCFGTQWTEVQSIRFTIAALWRESKWCNSYTDMLVL